MEKVKIQVNRMRILFLGMMGSLSAIPLAALLNAGQHIIAIGVPRDRVPPFLLPAGNGKPVGVETIAAPFLNPLPARQPGTILEIAARRHIPALALDDPAAAAAHPTLREMAPDLIIVSCWPRKLPRPFRQLPSRGCLNLHPSLLPAFRGPAPLFWTFQRGIRDTGVTIHFMDDGLDTGPIVQQRSVTLAEGVSGLTATEEMARLGGSVLVEVVEMAVRGSLPRRPQPPGPPADRWPRNEDFMLDPAWPVQRVFQFMRGTVEWGRPYPLQGSDPPILLAAAHRYILGSKPLTPRNNETIIPFADGELAASRFY